LPGLRRHGFNPKSCDRAAIADALKEALQDEIHQPPAAQAQTDGDAADGPNDQRIAKSVQKLTPRQLRAL
jgi:DNA-binding NarL/FixJ family response regulator